MPSDAGPLGVGSPECLRRRRCLGREGPRRQCHAAAHCCVQLFYQTRIAKVVAGRRQRVAAGWRGRWRQRPRAARGALQCLRRQGRAQPAARARHGGERRWTAGGRAAGAGQHSSWAPAPATNLLSCSKLFCSLDNTASGRARAVHKRDSAAQCSSLALGVRVLLPTAIAGSQWVGMGLASPCSRRLRL